MKFIKCIIDNWNYNNRSNIENTTFIAHRVVKGVDQYAPAKAYKRWNGKVECEIMDMSFDEEWREHVVSIGGRDRWINNKEIVKQALDNYIDLNLDRGKYAKERDVGIDYIKYP